MLANLCAIKGLSHSLHSVRAVAFVRLAKKSLMRHRLNKAMPILSVSGFRSTDLFQKDSSAGIGSGRQILGSQGKPSRIQQADASATIQQAHKN